MLCSSSLFFNAEEFENMRRQLSGDKLLRAGFERLLSKIDAYPEEITEKAYEKLKNNIQPSEFEYDEPSFRIKEVEIQIQSQLIEIISKYFDRDVFEKNKILFLVCFLIAMTSCVSKRQQLTEEDMGAYLFVFFSDPTHSLFMATSHDGYTFTAVNNGNPIMSGDTIAEQRGVRDPHITRGPDGAFYLAMTDLHIFAQREGLRETEWERPGEAYGWGNNRGLVLMKSYDLINWTRSNVRVDKAFPEKFGNIGCAWAPETIYDAKEGKMMIYFTMRIGNEKNQL